MVYTLPDRPQLPSDFNSHPIQVLQPDNSLIFKGTEAAGTGTELVVDATAATEVVRIICTGGFTRVSFSTVAGESPIPVTTTSMLMAPDVGEYYSFIGITSIWFLSDDGATTVTCNATVMK